MFPAINCHNTCFSPDKAWSMKQIFPLLRKVIHTIIRSYKLTNYLPSYEYFPMFGNLNIPLTPLHGKHILFTTLNSHFLHRFLQSLSYHPIYSHLLHGLLFHIFPPYIYSPYRIPISHYIYPLLTSLPHLKN